MAIIAEKLGSMLISLGALTTEQLEASKLQQGKTKLPLTRVLLALGFCTEKQIAKALAIIHNAPIVDLEQARIDVKASRLLSAGQARQLQALPLAVQANTMTRRLHVALGDPGNLATIDTLRFITGMEIIPVVAEVTRLTRAIDRAYRGLDFASANGDDAHILPVQGLAVPIELE